MVEAKEGNVDTNYFKDIIQKNEVTGFKSGKSGRGIHHYKDEYISGWFLDFFAYLDKKDSEGKIMRFEEDSIKVEKFKELANQMLIVPFTIKDTIHKKKYEMKYKVGFIGCDQNENKQVFPIQGWIVSPCTQEDKNSTL